ncbi:MAG: hypothetical protein Q3M24_16335 [Candidatus Electrothrix aestuarii]|uniref:Uncharacterized protein n=1 Tax=Candidatus Electrothrix aestuarii TaxID=3062594 RepID=A0AAU8LSK0_9BACT|nr:hypothetical protein [Candidatus Electrothrix aestuarii]
MLKQLSSCNPEQRAISHYATGQRQHLAEFILTSYPDKNIIPMKLQKIAYLLYKGMVTCCRQAVYRCPV